MITYKNVRRGSLLGENVVFFDFGTLTGAAAQDREILVECDKIEVFEVVGQFTGLGGSTSVKCGAYVYNSTTPDTQTVEDSTIGTLAFETAAKTTAGGRMRNRPVSPKVFTAAANSGTTEFGAKSVLLKLRATVAGAGSPTRFSGYIRFRALKGIEAV